MAFISSTARPGRLHLPHPLSSLFLLPARLPHRLPFLLEKRRWEGSGWAGEDPPAADAAVGASFLRLLPACGGQDAIGSALRVIRCLSLSNSEPGRQEAAPPGSRERADGLKRAPSSEGGGSGAGWGETERSELSILPR